MGGEFEFFHFLRGWLYAGGIVGFVKGGLDAQGNFGFGCPDEVEHGFEANQRFTGPVLSRVLLWGAAFTSCSPLMKHKDLGDRSAPEENWAAVSSQT